MMIPIDGEVLELDDLMDERVLFVQELLEPVLVRAEGIDAFQRQSDRKRLLKT